MHEHIARAIYYFGVHLLYASMVASATWLLTSISGASATTKYWIWVVTAFNFVLPTGALIDKLWTSHFAWAAPLAAIGGPVWHMTEGWPATALAVTWTIGTLAMLARLISRLRRERHDTQASAVERDTAPGFVANGIPVSFGSRDSTPAVGGVLYPRILLPVELIGCSIGRNWTLFCCMK